MDKQKKQWYTKLAYATKLFVIQIRDKQEMYTIDEQIGHVPTSW